MESLVDARSLLHVVISDIPAQAGRTPGSGRYVRRFYCGASGFHVDASRNRLGQPRGACSRGRRRHRRPRIGTRNRVVHDRLFSRWLLFGAAWPAPYSRRRSATGSRSDSTRATRLKIHCNSGGSNMPWRSGRLRSVRISALRRDPSGDGSDPAGFDDELPISAYAPLIETCDEDRRTAYHGGRSLFPASAPFRLLLRAC